MKPKTPLRCAFEAPSLDDDLDCSKLLKIKLRLSGINVVVPVEQITYLEADINYTLLHTKDNEHYLSARTIKYYEHLLNNNTFIRVHKSHIVNIAYIRDFNIHDKNAELSLEGGKHLEVSRRKLKQFKESHQIDRFLNI
jgi:two-component system, LytTR family, response regulator